MMADAESETYGTKPAKRTPWMVPVDGAPRAARFLPAGGVTAGEELDPEARGPPSRREGRL